MADVSDAAHTTRSHQHKWTTGWITNNKTYRECECGEVLMPNGQTVKSGARRYYAEMAQYYENRSNRSGR